MENIREKSRTIEGAGGVGTLGRMGTSMRVTGLMMLNMARECSSGPMEISMKEGTTTIRDMGLARNNLPMEISTR